MKRYMLFGPDVHCPGNCFEDFVKDFADLQSLKDYVIKQGYLDKYCNYVIIVDLEEKSQIEFWKQENLINMCENNGQVQKCSCINGKLEDFDPNVFLHCRCGRECWQKIVDQKDLE